MGAFSLQEETGLVTKVNAAHGTASKEPETAADFEAVERRSRRRAGELHHGGVASQRDMKSSGRKDKPHRRDLEVNPFPFLYKVTAPLEILAHAFATGAEERLFLRNPEPSLGTTRKPEAGRKPGASASSFCPSALRWVRRLLISEEVQ